MPLIKTQIGNNANIKLQIKHKYTIKNIQLSESKISFFLGSVDFNCLFPVSITVAHIK